jgi:hypothetical protein
MKRLALASVLALSISAAACGSSDGQAATASEGDQFCKLAKVAKDDNDALQNLDPTDTAKVKLTLSGAIDSLTIMAKEAPSDISATVNKLLAAEEKLESVLAANDYDFTKFAASDDGKKLIADDDISKTGQDVDAYLSDKCGIVVDSVPDDTVAADSVPTNDSVATDDSAATDDSGVLSDDSINSFLDIYEQGTNTTLTDEERSCLVGELSGKLSSSDLDEVVAGGQPSDEVVQTLALAFVGCNVAIQP